MLYSSPKAKYRIFCAAKINCTLVVCFAFCDCIEGTSVLCGLFKLFRCPVKILETLKHVILEPKNGVREEELVASFSRVTVQWHLGKICPDIKSLTMWKRHYFNVRKLMDRQVLSKVAYYSGSMEDKVKCQYKKKGKKEF